LIDLQREIHRIKDWLGQNRSTTKNIIVDVEARRELCCICGSPMKVQKTIRRTIVTLQHGCFHTHERVLFCPSGCRYPNDTLVTRRAESINDLVPIGANYGYDLEVFVGMERFIRHHQREEIRSALKAEYGISISTGSDKMFVRKETVCDWICAAAEGKSISSWRKKKSASCITVDKKLSQLLQQVSV
jgi:hypothetical protein